CHGRVFNNAPMAVMPINFIGSTYLSEEHNEISNADSDERYFSSKFIMPSSLYFTLLSRIS
ncbi:hypothetical protein, partial [Serratia marcescens]|uniref:hypothetical protein n=1 Tax=Serratia marcescens TaxID=615 RepID=UPI002360841B